MGWNHQLEKIALQLNNIQRPWREKSLVSGWWIERAEGTFAKDGEPRGNGWPTCEQGWRPKKNLQK